MILSDITSLTFLVVSLIVLLDMLAARQVSSNIESFSLPTFLDKLCIGTDTVHRCPNKHK